MAFSKCLWAKQKPYASYIDFCVRGKAVEHESGALFKPSRWDVGPNMPNTRCAVLPKWADKLP